MPTRNGKDKKCDICREVLMEGGKSNCEGCLKIRKLLTEIHKDKDSEEHWYKDRLLYAEQRLRGCLIRPVRKQRTH